MESKICTTCKINKSYTEFYIHKKTKDGYKCQCKECERHYRFKNADKTKVYNKQYAIKNTEKLKQYRVDNAEKIQLNTKLYSIKNADKIKQYRIDNAGYIKQYAQQYRQSEHGKLVKRVSQHRRRALLNNNTPVGKHHTYDDIILKLKLQQGKCVYCNISIKKYYQIDHIIPLVKGGSNETSNIQLLCEKCNGVNGKWKKLPHEFAQRHGKLF